MISKHIFTHTHNILSGKEKEQASTWSSNHQKEKENNTTTNEEEEEEEEPSNDELLDFMMGIYSLERVGIAHDSKEEVNFTIYYSFIYLFIYYLFISNYILFASLFVCFFIIIIHPFLFIFFLSILKRSEQLYRNKRLKIYLIWNLAFCLSDNYLYIILVWKPGSYLIPMIYYTYS